MMLRGYDLCWNAWCWVAGAAVAVVLCGHPSPTLASGLDHLSFSHLNQEDGLPNNDVWSIAQDHRNFMWFGTRYGGIARFDGYEFKVFEHDPNNASSLSHNYVWTTLADSTGTLWVGTNGGGLNRYDEKRDAFVRYPYGKEDPTWLPHSNIKAILEDSAGRLWIGSNGGLSLFDRATDSFTTYAPYPQNPEGLAGSSVRAIGEDRNTGLLWLGTRRNGISIFDPGSERFENHRHDPNDPSSLSNDAVNYIHQDRLGNIWIGTRKGLNLFDPKTKTFKRFFHDGGDPTSVSGDWVQKIYEDRQNRLWVATLSGICIYNRNTDTFDLVASNTANSRAFHDKSVNTIFEDRVGALWFGTVNNGINRLDPLPEKFQLHTSDHPVQDTEQGSHAAQALLIDRDGIMWLGTQNGLERMDGENTTHFHHEPTDPHSLSNDNIHAITQDRDGTIWVGTLHGLNRFNGTSFERFLADNEAPGSISGDNIIALTADVNGGIWIGINGVGVDFFDGTAFTSFKPKKDNPRSLPSRYPKALWPDDMGAGVWVGTNNMGLAHIDLNTGEVETHLPLPSNPSSEVHNFVRSITSDDNDLLWLATNAGVFSFDTKTKVFRDRITTANGLPTNTIMSVDTDGKGSLWIGMGRGLSRLNPKDGTVRNYKFGSRFKKPSFLPNASTHDRHGGKYFGTQYGLLTFNPKDIKDNTNPPSVALTGMSLFDEEVQPGAEGAPLNTTLMTANELALNYDQSFFSFTFAALDFSAPGDNAYAYKLDGFDRDWRQVSPTSRKAVYTNVPPGRYMFRVKAANNDDVWNDKGISLAVTIHPPWWKTTWFRIIAALTVVSIIVGGYIRVRFSALLRHRYLEAQIADRTQKLIQEVADHKQTEEALKVSERKFRKVVSNMPDMYFCTNADGRFTEISQEGERLLGYTQHELLGSNFSDHYVVASEREANVQKIIASQGKPVIVYARLKTKGGREIMIESHSMARLDSGGNVIGIEGIARDVTEQKLAEYKIMEAKKQAEEASKAKTKFLAAASHDLRQPLQAMNLILYALQQIEDSSQKLEMINLLRSSSDALGGLLNSLLDISRLEAGVINVEKKVFPVGAVMENTVAELRHVLNENNKVKIRWVPCSANIFSDPIHIDNIVRNFITNSIKHTESGDILVGCRRRRGGDIEIQVWDTGKGIEELHQNKIFDEFYQIENEARNKDMGLGLGLSIVKKMANLLGHEIGMKSWPGRGSVFWIRVPISTEDMVVLDQATSLTAPVTFNGKSIFIIDDEENIRAALAKMLEGAGYRVTALSCTDTPQCLSQIQNAGVPDIIIADYRLANNKTGVDAIMDVRKKTGIEVPSILLTGDTAPERLQEASESGFELLHKPIHGEVLLKKIYQTLSGT